MKKYSLSNHANTSRIYCVVFIVLYILYERTHNIWEYTRIINNYNKITNNNLYHYIFKLDAEWNKLIQTHDIYKKQLYFKFWSAFADALDIITYTDVKI